MSSSSSQQDVQSTGPILAPAIMPLTEFSVGSSSTPTVVGGDVQNVINNNESAQGENPFAKKIRRKTSSVWSEFTVIKLHDGSEKVECNHCKQKLTRSKGGATTQYKRHLLHCGRRKVKAEGQLNISAQPTQAKSHLESSIDFSITNWRYDQARMRELISHMVLVHELPFKFVEYEMFNIVMRAASPHYEKISRTTVRNDCFSSYEIGKKRLQNLLASVSRVSVTTDLWKSGQDIHYMVLTCHFVDADWKLQKRILNFVDVPPPHRATNIHDILYKCLKDWAIENKLASITVDNAAYNTSAVNMLKASLEFQKKLPLDGRIFHVRCCAHILNLLVEDEIGVIKPIIDMVRESVKYVTASQHRIVMFSEIAQQLHLPKKKLFLDCVTRWNATYAMLSCALEFKDVFPRFQDRDTHYSSCPTEHDWAMLEEVCSFLEVFNQVTELISGSEYPTSNLFLSELWRIKEMLDDKVLNGPLHIRDLAQRMKEKFDKYWGNCNLLISLGAVLDPRNKMQMINFAFNSMYSEDIAQTHINDVCRSLYDLYHSYVEDYKSSNSDRLQLEGDSGNPVVSSSSFSKTKPVYGKKKYESYIRNDYTIHSVKSELDVYLDDGVLIDDENPTAHFDVLDWWKANNLKYRILSRMACDILSIPITTVSSEASFSAGGRVIDQYRASLGTDTVQILLCGSDWYRNFYGIKRKNKNKDELKEIALV